MLQKIENTSAPMDALREDELGPRGDKCFGVPRDEQGKPRKLSSKAAQRYILENATTVVCNRFADTGMRAPYTSDAIAMLYRMARMAGDERGISVMSTSGLPMRFNAQALLCAQPDLSYLKHDETHGADVRPASNPVIVIPVSNEAIAEYSQALGTCLGKRRVRKAFVLLREAGIPIPFTYRSGGGYPGVRLMIFPSDNA